jgi:hypothetical protein
MKRQPDVMASSADNPNRTRFYERDGVLRVTINVDRTSTLDRKASDADIQRFHREYSRFVGRDPSEMDAEAEERPRRRGRPRKSD